MLIIREFVEDVHITSEVTNNVVDKSVKSSTPALDKIYVHKESISDVQDALVESSTLIPDDIEVLEDETSDFEHVLMESNIPVQVVGYSLAIPMIENGIEHETVDTNVITFNKKLELSSRLWFM